MFRGCGIRPVDTTVAPVQIFHLPSAASSANAHSAREARPIGTSVQAQLWEALLFSLQAPFRQRCLPVHTLQIHCSTTDLRGYPSRKAIRTSLPHVAPRCCSPGRVQGSGLGGSEHLETGPQRTSSTLLFHLACMDPINVIFPVNVKPSDRRLVVITL